MNFSQGIWSESYYEPEIPEWIQKNCKGDTVIDGEVYFKLLESKIIYYYSEPDTILDRYYGAIKENESKQVLFIPYFESDPTIIYDFNLDIGDTIKLYHKNFVVNFIDSVEYCGKYHKRYVQQYIDAIYDEALIEGIGYSSGLLGYYNDFNYPAEIYTILDCYTELNNQQCENCDLIDSFTESRFNYTIFPNPTKGNIYVTSLKSLESIIIFNLIGTETFSIKNINNNSVIIPLSSCIPGMYLLQITFEDMTSSSSVIIKI